MLQSLRLTNFAVMQEAEVALGPGLTVVTGETGTGKSMLIDALALLVGARAEADVVRAGADEAVVEGVFECTPALKARLEEAGLTALGNEVCVRRSVGRAGRGKVHVDGSLVTVGLLGRLMRGLVDVAGQHDHLTLLDSTRHVALVDGFGSPYEAWAEYESAWHRVQASERALAALGGDDAHVGARIDFVTFQLDELQRVDPKQGEDEALEAERRRLASTQKLRQLAAQAEALVSTSDGAALERVGRALRDVQEAARLDTNLAGVAASLQAAAAEIDEASRGLSRYLSALDADPTRLAQVEDRLDVLKRLCRKHVCPLEALIAKRVALAAELSELQGRAERRQAVTAERATAQADAQLAAAKLTAQRIKRCAEFSLAVGARLGQLAMPKARFEAVREVAALGPTGADSISLHFSANPGEPPKPLAKVASGGEASRLMLALRAAVTGTDGVATVVFDEADAGVGGAVADVVGRLIKDVSARAQVLCITHLPQVAVHATAHLRLEKTEVKGKTRSRVTALDLSDRTEELARMLSGFEVTREAKAAAAALLRSAQKRLAGQRERRAVLASQV
jgi:DNA repair protein RecN (Recombination protein N)